MPALSLSMVAKGGPSPWGLFPAAGRMPSARPGTAHVRGQVHKDWLVAAEAGSAGVWAAEAGECKI